MIAKAVLELDDQGDDEGIMNVLSGKTETVTIHSSVNSMRKNYLKISLLIHPDKIGRYVDFLSFCFVMCSGFVAVVFLAC